MSKLSVHVTDPGNRTGYGDFLRIPFERGNPVGIVYQCNANTKADVIKYSPDTKLVYRRQSETWKRLPQDFFCGDPVLNCENWLLGLKEGGKNLIDYWKMNPADYYDPLNEPVPQTIEQAKWLNTWMIHALDIANRYGLKLAMFSFSVGRPEYNLWTYLFGALRYGKQSGAILSLHQYGVDGPLVTRNPDGTLSDYALHTSFRHRFVYQILPLDCQIPLIISEAACGNGYAVSLTGQAFLNDAIEYDKEIMNDPYVLGANLFQLGGSESNLVSILPSLTYYVANTPNTTHQEEMVEKLPYVVTVHLAPQNATLAQLEHVQSQAFKTKSTVCQSADDARFLVKYGLTGSKVVIYDPQSWPGGVQGILNFFAGYTVELVYFTYPEIKFNSPIKDIPWKITDHFNAPRTYANGLHEGLDLDCYDETIGKSVKIYAALDGVVENVITTWSGTGYGIHVIIKHDWYGITYKTWYCHLSSATAVKGATVHQGDQVGVGGATGTSAIHLHFMIQKIPGGLDGYYTPNVVDPEPITIPNTIVTLPIPKKGVGMGNLQVLTPMEMSAVSVSKVGSFLAHTMPSSEESAKIVNQLKSINPNIYIVGRLFFSADSQNKTLFDASSFVAYCRAGLDGLYASGVRYYQIHNEPNLVQEGMGWNWVDGVEFGNWLYQVLLLLKARYPDAKWGYPGLSPQPNTEQFWASSKFAMDMCDWVGVHSYWQTRGTTGWGMESLDGGYHWKRLSTNKPLVITEFSNNSPTVSDTIKGQEYRDYYKLVGIPAFSFCLSWSGDPNHEGWVYNNTLTKIPEIVGT